MRAEKGDRLVTHGRTVGDHDRVGKITEVLGTEGRPPYRVTYEDGQECVLAPGPDTVVQHEAGGTGSGRR
ncbi:hypothetical protein SRB5_42020 [Streptomyces sp. RB5]|uniref:DUF1918 domain-containing protein n=1 Tax=Streptomyces smaragdinus TaxID=2585196 RepID=A0A7K0CKV2_9ACTN|nr:DUF1918 domain-containing protein [Streptomyces smaragdinus]MQY14041.1 hypothetical protein [Streptomyces smaragdinus]